MKRSVGLNVFLNTVKQLLSVIFPLITIPYISRILGSSNYGKYNFSYSVINYFILIAGLGISTYAIREGAKFRNNKKKFNEFADQVYTINIMSMIFSYILLFVIIGLFFLNNNYLYLLLVQSLAIALQTVGVDWVNSVYEDYLYITVRYILFQILALALMFIFVRTKNDYLAYAIIVVIASYGGNIINIFYVRRYVKLKLTKKINLKKHIGPIFILFGNAVATTLYVNSDTTLLGIFRSSTDVGIYSLVAKIYTALKQIVNAAVIASMPRLSAYYSQKEIEKFKNLSESLLSGLYTIIFPVVIGGIIYSKQIILLVSGDEYLIGYKSFQLLCLALFFSSLGSFYGTCILIPLKKERKLFTATILGGIVNVCLNIILIPIMNFNGAALTTLISEALVCILNWRNSSVIINIKIRKNDYKSILIGCICVCLVCLLSNYFIYNKFLEFFIGVIFSVISYFVVLVLLKNSLVYSFFQKSIKKGNYDK